jgi:hypothetical protein
MICESGGILGVYLSVHVKARRARHTLIESHKMLLFTRWLDQVPWWRENGPAVEAATLEILARFARA